MSRSCDIRSSSSSLAFIGEEELVLISLSSLCEEVLAVSEASEEGEGAPTDRLEPSRGEEEDTSFWILLYRPKLEVLFSSRSPLLPLVVRADGVAGLRSPDGGRHGDSRCWGAEPEDEEKDEPDRPGIGTDNSLGGVSFDTVVDALALMLWATALGPRGVTRATVAEEEESESLWWSSKAAWRAGRGSLGPTWITARPPRNGYSMPCVVSPLLNLIAHTTTTCAAKQFSMNPCMDAGALIFHARSTILHETSTLKSAVSDCSEAALFSVMAPWTQSLSITALSAQMQPRHDMSCTEAPAFM
jgi:hypothetical protein